MAANGGPDGTAPPDPLEIAARFILIIAGIVVVAFGMFQVASVSRTTTHSETNYMSTLDSSSPPVVTHVASDTRTTQDVKPDERPSDAALGIVFGVGVVLLIAGGYYNRKFTFSGPGGVVLQGNFAAQVAARTMSLAMAHARSAELTPEMMSSIVADSINAYSPHVIRIRVPRFRPRAPAPADLDAVINQQIEEALARNQPPAK